MTINKEEETKRIELAKAHLAEIGNSATFRKVIEEAEQANNLEAYWQLQDKLSRELAPHLIRYQGSSEATAFCLRLAEILNGIDIE